jgi:hypothetical protein
VRTAKTITFDCRIGGAVRGLVTRYSCNTFQKPLQKRIKCVQDETASGAVVNAAVRAVAAVTMAVSVMW